MSAHNDTNIVTRALQMALNNKPKVQNVLLHSDQGSTYRTYDYVNLFKANNIIQSMYPKSISHFVQGSRKGECHDNTVAESFFNTLKTELINQQTRQTRAETKVVFFEYIEVFYNKTRRHSTISYQSSNDFEQVFYKKKSQLRLSNLM